MKISSAWIFGVAGVQYWSASVSAQTVRKFVDDTGYVHTTDKMSPTFMANARASIALMHQFGYDDGVGIKGQLLGSYGSYRPRGSQMNLEDPDAKPNWASEPTYKEIQFLKSLPYNFSPNCYDNNQACYDIEFDMVQEANPDLWIYINNGIWYTGEVRMKRIVDEVIGGQPIFIDTNSYGEGCVTWHGNNATFMRHPEKCSARSLIDIIERTNELAAFLGIEDKQKNQDEDKNRMCLAAKRLSRAAQSAQEDGLRIMAANAFLNPIFEGGVSLNPIDPLVDAYLRSYEELGVPVLHPGVYSSPPEIIPASEWFPNCVKGQKLTECNDEAVYPIDIWLMEGRRLPNGTMDEEEILLQFFPDKGLLGKQYTHWPMNDGAISYRSISRSFHNMADMLNRASRVYPRTECTRVDVTAESFLKRTTGGIGPGEYACYDQSVQQSKYLQCPEGMGSDPEDDDGWPGRYNDPDDGVTVSACNKFAGLSITLVATIGSTLTAMLLSL